MGIETSTTASGKAELVAHKYRRGSRLRGYAILLVSVALLAAGCETINHEALCASSPQGIYFNGDGTAFVASQPPSFSEVLLWKVDLESDNITDVWVENNRDPRDPQVLKRWEQVSEERYARHTWLNKDPYQDPRFKEIQIPGGAKYRLSWGESISVEFEKDGVRRGLIQREADDYADRFGGDITLVRPEKVYALVTMSGHDPGKPIQDQLQRREALLYVIDAQSGQVVKQIELWPSVGDGLYRLLAVAPNGLVYAINSWTNKILVIDPEQDEVTGSITLCR